MNNKYERINKIDQQIFVLEEIINKLKSEKNCLIQEIKKDEGTILNQLPARGKNALTKYGIDSDYKLKLFLMGDDTSINPYRCGFKKEKYKKASTYLDKLMCIQNIGYGTSKDIIELLTKINFI